MGISEEAEHRDGREPPRGKRREFKDEFATASHEKIRY
jgi:hypothetical protein